MLKYTLRNISGRDLLFVRPINLRLAVGEERVVFLSDPQASAFRQNPGEVKLEKVKPATTADEGAVRVVQHMAEEAGAENPDLARTLAEAIAERPSVDVEKEEPPEPEGEPAEALEPGPEDFKTARRKK